MSRRRKHLLDTDDTDESASETDAAEAGTDDEADMPRAVRVTLPHGFIADDGTHRHWPEGAVVDDPEDVRLLIARGAHVKPLA